MSRFSAILRDTFKLDTEEKQIAFLDNLCIAGYFKEEVIWPSMNIMQFDKTGAKKVEMWGENGPKEAFLEIRKTLDQTESNNPEILLKELFNGDSKFTDQNIEDLVLFLAQNAFGRAPGQERNELKTQDWAKDPELAKRYLNNARSLGLIDEIPPSRTEYDETWVQGAARFRTTTRIAHLKELMDQAIAPGFIRLMTGKRELTAELDIVGGNIDESKDFMLALASDNGIKLNEANKFISYDNNPDVKENNPRILTEDEAVERRKNKQTVVTRLNYAPEETRRVTETLMAKKVFEEIFGRKIMEDEIIDSGIELGKTRPDTITNATDVAKLFKQQQLEDEKNILIISNQPYTTRQMIANQRIFSQEGVKANFDCTGKRNELGASAIHSDFAILINETFLLSIGLERGNRLCNPDQLTFSGRCKNNELIPDMPLRSPKNSTTEFQTYQLQNSQSQSNSK